MPRIFIVGGESIGMETERLRHLLEHWIEHNDEHVKKYKEWADRIRSEREDIAELIEESIAHFEKGNEVLRKVMERL